MALKRNRSILVITWKRKFTKEAYTSLTKLMPDLPGYSIHTIRYHLYKKKSNFEDNIIKIERLKLHG